jgi:hypothetical protein
MRLARCRNQIGFAAQMCGEAWPLREVSPFFFRGYAAGEGAASGKMKNRGFRKVTDLSHIKEAGR